MWASVLMRPQNAVSVGSSVSFGAELQRTTTKDKLPFFPFRMQRCRPNRQQAEKERLKREGKKKRKIKTRRQMRRQFSALATTVDTTFLMTEQTFLLKLQDKGKFVSFGHDIIKYCHLNIDWY